MAPSRALLLSSLVALLGAAPWRAAALELRGTSGSSASSVGVASGLDQFSSNQTVPGEQEVLAVEGGDEMGAILTSGTPAATVMLSSSGKRRALATHLDEEAQASSAAHEDRTDSDEQKKAAIKRRSAQQLTLGALTALIVCAATPVLLSQGLMPFCAVLAYIFSLVAVKLCVKEIFKSGYPYPYATTAFHMFVTAIVASCIERPNVDGARSTLLISASKAASLALNNMALVFGTAAFVSILGACTPATTYAVEIARYRSTTTARTMSIVAVCVGAMLCVKGELSFSLLSTVLTLGACFCRSLKTVWSHDLMQVDMSPYGLAAWTAIWSFAIMLVATLIKEGSEPFQVFPAMSTHTKIVFFAGAILATALNVLMCFVLKYLGPLQQNIFGQLELVAVLTLAMAWLHETVTPIQWMGVLLIGIGCMLSKLDCDSLVKRLLLGRMREAQTPVAKAS